MKNTFDEVISRLDMTKEGISELEDISIETSKTEMQREKRIYKMKQNTQEQGRIPKYIFVMITPEREEKKEYEYLK